MEGYAIDVINSIKRTSDNSTFVNTLIKVSNDTPDLFYNNVNNFLNQFERSLNPEAIVKIKKYNNAYANWRNEQTLIQMASQYDANNLDNIFNDIFISPSADSILGGMSRSSISKRRGPSKKKRK